MNTDDLHLHSAILLASGFECLSIEDARFLNAYRHHLDNKYEELNQVLLITPMDFELGGLFNPTDRDLDPDIAYQRAIDHIQNFPYLSKLQIIDIVYKEKIEATFQRIITETLETIDATLGFNAMTIAQLFETELLAAKAVKMLHNTKLHNKIHALHRCGLGERLQDAYYWIFYKYRCNAAGQQFTDSSSN